MLRPPCRKVNPEGRPSVLFQACGDWSPELNGAEIEVERDLDRSLDTALPAAPAAGRLYALPTYTALLELRDLLARRGLAKRWSE